jgi:TAT (twin-arginine translocation) pathway signal sequence
MQSGWLEQFTRTQQQRTQTTGAESNGVSRRDFLQSGLAAGVAAGMATGAIVNASVAGPVEAAPAQQTPIGPPWWPSPWGPDDEAGASNWITPDRVLEAARLIRTGRIFELGRVYEAGMPLFGARVFGLRIPGTPTVGPLGSNQIIFHDDFLVGEIGQVGTQFDGLGHIGCAAGVAGDLNQMRFYNGFTEAEMADPYGLKKLGIEKVKPFFTRGVLAAIPVSLGPEDADGCTNGGGERGGSGSR